MVQRYALVCGERVIDIVEGERPCYEIGGVLSWVEAPPGVTRRSVFRDGNFASGSNDEIHAELDSLDRVLPRALEDLIAALGTAESQLPEVMRGRLARKRALRAMMTERPDGAGRS